MTGFYGQRNAPEVIRHAVRGVVDESIRVVSQVPQDWQVHHGTLVTVVGDGTPSQGRYTTTENVRIAVYHRFEPSARRIAQQIDAFLLNPRTTWGFFISPGPGLISARDDGLGAWVCAVTVVAESPKEGVQLT